jgi:peptidylprolyl isomerase
MQVAIILLPLLTFQGGKLQITDQKVGKGPAAKAGDYLTMDYTGTLMNGKKFDSSKDPGRQPFAFTLGGGQVIKGWDKGIVGMKVGGMRTLIIPASMGYGDAGAPPDIPPKATLKFVVELKRIDNVTITVLKPGHGPGAQTGDTVTLHYKGMFKDGKKFDSSYDRGQPFPVHLGQHETVPGFEMGLMGIKEGEKRRVVIPSALGYGARAMGPIPANTDLVFELEALKISK